MYIARKLNRILKIEETNASDYAKMGYKVETESGEVVFQPEVTTIAGANELIKELRSENENLQASIKALKDEIASLKKKNKKESAVVIEAKEN